MSWSLLCQGNPRARTMQLPSISSSIELRGKPEQVSKQVSNSFYPYATRVAWGKGEKGVAVTFRYAARVLGDYRVA